MNECSSSKTPGQKSRSVIDLNQSLMSEKNTVTNHVAYYPTNRHLNSKAHKLNSQLINKYCELGITFTITFTDHSFTINVEIYFDENIIHLNKHAQEQYSLPKLFVICL